MDDFTQASRQRVAAQANYLQHQAQQLSAQAKHLRGSLRKEQRQRRKRYAERKAKWKAEKAKRELRIEQAERQEAPIMAFGGDERRQSAGFGFFGN